MTNGFRNRFKMRPAAVAFGLALMTAMPLSAQADELWTINMAQSRFGSVVKTIVLEHNSGALVAPNAVPASFLVIDKAGKVYLVTEDSTANAGSGKDVKPVAYNRWRDMNMVQIGDGARVNIPCSFRCQHGLPEKQIAVTFFGKTFDFSQMDKTVVLNAH